jgi:hypothetical protein
MVRIGIAFLVAALSVARTADAQTASNDLLKAAERQSTVYVIDSAGIEATGRLLGVEGSLFRVQTPNGEASFDLHEIQVVYRRGDSIWSGAVNGAVIGATLGLLTASKISCGPLLGPHQRCSALESLGITGSWAGFGAGIGIGIDALVRGRTRIYPVLSGHSAGAMISRSWH